MDITSYNRINYNLNLVENMMHEQGDERIFLFIFFIN